MNGPSVWMMIRPIKPPMTEEGMNKRWKMEKPDRTTIPKMSSTLMAQKDMTAIIGILSDKNQSENGQVGSGGLFVFLNEEY